MSKRTYVTNQILEQGTLPLFFTPSEKDSIKITHAVYAAGVKVIEYTNRGEEALRNFKALKEEARKSMPDLQLGVGTIKTVQEANNFINAGADFIVAPTINPEVGRTAHNAGLLWIPGCMTPTEISIAQEHHADIIKIFPANILGVDFLKSIRGLFTGQKFMPTGGVNLSEENIRGWFDAGVCAVGMGSQLISSDIIKEKKYDVLKARTEKVLELINAIRKK